jgi:carbon monoxide dehydrogenase subunit G
MAKVEHTIVVERSPADVFAYLTNPENLPEWQAGVIEGRKDSPGPTAQGTSLTEVRTFLGRRMESKLEVTEYEQDRLFTIKVVSGPVPFQVRHRLEPADGGTRIHVSGEGEPGGFFKLAEPLVIRQVKRQVETNFATLKDLLEARA